MDIVEKLKLGVASNEEKNEIAKQYLNVVNYYSKGDTELFSAGLAGLEFAIRNAHNIRDLNIKGWVFFCITKYVSRCKAKQPLVLEPIEGLYENNNLYDDICELCQNEIELEIIKKRVDGYKDSEIASQIGLSKSKVHRIRMQISVRFNNS